MSTWTFAFLGVPRLLRDETPVDLPRAKGIALLLYLAANRRGVARERVLDLLWPESAPAAARKNLRNTLWAIGEALGDGVLEQDGALLRLHSRIVVDTHALEDALHDPAPVAAWEVAVAHYGVLAEGLVLHEAPEFELWLVAERERLAGCYSRVLDHIIAHHQASGDWPAMLAHAQRALAADPLRETIYLAAIEAHVHLGQRAQAAHCYATLADTLERELGVEPLLETAAHYQALLATTAPAPPLPSVARAAPPTPFVGRAAELAVLAEEAALARAGHARVALISGDLGMGKSRLWQAWQAQLPPGATVLVTHTLETSEPMPFGPLLRLFRQPGPVRAVWEQPGALAPIWLAELARLFPEIAAARPELPPPLAFAPAEERSRLFQALAALLQVLATDLLVLVIDDLHWADSSTLDWLVFLIDQLHDAPLLLIGTFRPQDAPPQLAAISAGWQRRGQMRALPLDPLSIEERHELLAQLGRPTDGDAQARIAQQSGGNPYFLLELSRAPADHTSCDLAALVQNRVRATVPESAMPVLQAAAVLHDGASFAVLQATSGRSEEATLDALDALAGAGVLGEHAETYQFVHPLVADVVRRDLPPARRAFWHRRAAAALEHAYAPQPDRVAGQLVEHHAAAGASSAAAHYAEQAAAQALAVNAFVEAAAFARRALEWQPTPVRQLMLGQALTMIGDKAAAQEQLEAAFGGFVAADDAAGSTKASVSLALLAINATQPEIARRWLSHAPIGRTEADDPALSGQAMLLLAGVERQSQAYDAAASHLYHAAQLAQTYQLPLLDAKVAFERGNLLSDRGDRRAALALFTLALEIAHASASPIDMVMAQNNLAYHMLLAGDLANAQAHIGAAAELMERHKLSFLWQYVYSTTGEIAAAQGAFDAAATAFEHAFAAARSWDNNVHMANTRVNQALLAAAQHDADRARTLIAEARAVFGTAVDPFVRRRIMQVEQELV